MLTSTIDTECLIAHSTLHSVEDRGDVVRDSPCITIPKVTIIDSLRELLCRKSFYEVVYVVSSPPSTEQVLLDESASWLDYLVCVFQVIDA